MSEKQRQEFRTSTEDLTRKLHMALLERDKFHSIKHNESTNQDAALLGLHSRIEELVSVNLQQDVSLERAQQQIELLQITKADYENTVSYIILVTGLYTGFCVLVVFVIVGVILLLNISLLVRVTRNWNPIRLFLWWTCALMPMLLHISLHT